MARTGRPKAVLDLTDDERAQLEPWARRAKSAQPLALRSRIVLACAEGLANTAVAADLGCSAAHGRQVAAPVPRAGAWTGWPTSPGRGARRRSPTPRSRMWSSRRWSPSRPMRPTGRGRRWPSAPACPSRRSAGSGGRSGSSRTGETFKLSTDPLFVEKVLDVVGLYLNPPEAGGRALRGREVPGPGPGPVPAGVPDDARACPRSAPTTTSATAPPACSPPSTSPTAR